MEAQQGKIGVYDSGLGGLVLLRELHKKFPQFDYVFFGDEKNFPYGDKPADVVKAFAIKNITHLFEDEGCSAVLIACNTVSTMYDELKAHFRKAFPDKLLFGIIAPTVSVLPEDTYYTIFGTTRTVLSHAYKKQIEGMYPSAVVSEIAVQDLARLIEEDGDVESYLKSFIPEVLIEPSVCVLVCTHYGVAIETFKKVFPQFTEVLSQEKIIPRYFEGYLTVRPDAISLFSIHGTLRITASAHQGGFEKYADKWFKGVPVEQVEF